MGSASPIATKIERLESGRIQIAIELDMPWRVFIKYPALGTLGQPGIVSEGSVFTEQLQHRRGQRVHWLQITSVGSRQLGHSIPSMLCSCVISNNDCPASEYYFHVYMWRL